MEELKGRVREDEKERRREGFFTEVTLGKKGKRWGILPNEESGGLIG